MKIAIPGSATFHIKNLVLDYNEAIAIDGLLDEGVAEHLENFSPSPLSSISSPQMLTGQQQLWETETRSH